MDDPATIEELVMCLSGEPERAVAAVEALRERGARAAVPAIAGLASSAHGAVRRAVVDALGTLGRDRTDVAGPALVQLLADSDDYIRAEAADSLGVIGYAPAAVPVAERLRADPNATVRAAAAETLGDLGDANAVPALLHALADGDGAVRGYAANALGLLGTSDIAPTLLRRVECEPSAATRGELHGALYRLGSADALSAMLDLLAAADADLATNLLNTLEDVAYGRQPAGLALDAPRIDDALAALERRLALVASRVAAVRAELPSTSG